MAYTWKKMPWKKEEMEDSISLDKLTGRKIRADFGNKSRKIHLGWRYKKCCHYILFGGYVHVSTSHIEYELKGE